MSRGFIKRDVRGGPDGFVLVSVLWILAILTVVSLGFARRSMLERRVAWYALDREQAQQMARGAAERGLFELANKLTLDDYNNQLGYTGLDQRWARPVELLKEADYFEGARGEAFKNDTCSFRIEDCERYLSLNEARAALLEEVDGLTRRTVEKIMDRRRSETGYQPERFRSVDELRALQDIPDRVWYGREKGEGIADLLTVWGGGEINVNTAPLGVLQTIPRLDEDVAEQIVEYRAGRDGEPNTRDDRSFPSLNGISRRLGVSAEKVSPITRHCTTDSRFFIVKAHATRRQGKIHAYCTVVVELNGATPVILEWRENIVGT